MVFLKVLWYINMVTIQYYGLYHITIMPSDTMTLPWYRHSTFYRGIWSAVIEAVSYNSVCVAMVFPQVSGKE